MDFDTAYDQYESMGGFGGYGDEPNYSPRRLRRKWKPKPRTYASKFSTKPKKESDRENRTEK